MYLRSHQLLERVLFTVFLSLHSTWCKPLCALCGQRTKHETKSTRTYLSLLWSHQIYAFIRDHQKSASLIEEQMAKQRRHVTTVAPFHSLNNSFFARPASDSLVLKCFAHSHTVSQRLTLNLLALQWLKKYLTAHTNRICLWKF